MTNKAGTRRIDLTGQKFGKLFVVNFSHVSGNGDAIWNCLCDCGGNHVVRGGNLRKGSVTSCGCKYYGKTKLKNNIYKIWRGILDRCVNENDKRYNNYGGRGITVCDRWLESFENFYDDMGDRPEGMSIERIDNDKGYSKENCMWATSKQQQNNTRANNVIEYSGLSMNTTEFTEIPRITIISRISRGWTVGEALGYKQL